MIPKDILERSENEVISHEIIHPEVRRPSQICSQMREAWHSCPSGTMRDQDGLQV